ncbi:PD-(D/E)XK nuclease family protein, partial [Buchnera aphidicola]|nr:PD-(D/E)XK nuclease family protein [Buchnera aphidicola]
KTILNKVEFNNIIQFFDPISNISPKIFFNNVTGILKGFIDLIFLWKNKYYILDYKSNCLGDEKDSYSKKNIKKEIIKKRYDVQYQIYTLAAHQYLKNKLQKYTYKKNFGGIFYLFLRGIDKKNEKNG